MKKIITLCALAAVIILAASCNNAKAKTEAETTAQPADSTVLVAYFSASGVTAGEAAKIADVTGGVLYEIAPEQPYSDEDLDYQNENSRSSIEHQNPESRPAIKGDLDITPFETIYLGFPVWWDKAPQVIYTFLDSYDFSGKKIVVFATAHSSGLTPSFEALKQAYPAYDMTEGQIYNVANREGFADWVQSL